MTARTLEPFDPEVVAPWRLGDGPRGALLIHGFASTPPELRRLGEILAREGFRCHAPALPGHGTTPHELERTRWQDWAAHVQVAFDELATECSDVVVAGQSMGGTLALHLAAHDHRVRAVATLAAPIWLSGPLPALLPILSHVVRWHRAGDDVDLWNPEAVEELHSYGMRPTRSINELRRLCAVVRNELAEVRAPVFILHGERDRSIDPRCAKEIAQRLVGSEAVQLRMLPRSGHGISVDVDRDSVNADILRWFARFAPAETAVKPPRGGRRSLGAQPESRVESRSRAAISGSITGFAGGPSSRSR
ncbi:MAG TPA: alpha/beta fold hydrolase [Candidatus Acidoferrales bacterium]|nr:alpha/beta fold hydrolase [Candidatus Acidoferrales bacterium]